MFQKEPGTPAFSSLIETVLMVGMETILARTSSAQALCLPYVVSTESLKFGAIFALKGIAQIFAKSSAFAGGAHQHRRGSGDA